MIRADLTPLRVETSFTSKIKKSLDNDEIIKQDQPQRTGDSSCSSRQEMVSA